MTLSLPLPPSSAFFCTSGLSYPSWPRMPFPPCWHDGDPLGFQFSQTRISTAVLAILLHSSSSHECLVSALVSWALLDSLIGFAHWTMSSVRAGMACPPLNLHHLARCSEHSRSSNHFYGKHQEFISFFLVSLLDCIKRTEKDLFQQDWHIRSNWFIPNKRLIGLPSPSKTLPIILLCE